MSSSYFYYLKHKDELSVQEKPGGIRVADLFSWPNFITLFRLGLIIPMSFSLAHQWVEMFVVSTLLFALGDLADGYLAFLLNKRTRFGRYFDSTVDKLSLLALLVVSLIYNLVPHWLILMMVIINLIQLFFGLWHLGVKRGQILLKTYLGPLIGLLFIVSALTNSKLDNLLNLTVSLLSLNHLYYYLKEIFAGQLAKQKNNLIARLDNYYQQNHESNLTRIIFSYFQNKIINRQRGLEYKIQSSKKIFTLPNFITIIRLIILWPVIYFFYHNLYWLATGLIILFIFLDFYDGHLARKSRLETALGQILDAAVDKFALLALLFICLKVGWLPGWLFVLILIRVGLIFITAALVYLFTTAPLPIAYYSLVSVLAILANFVWQTDFWLLLATVLTIQLIINYLYQGFVTIKKHGFCLKVGQPVFDKDNEVF